MTKNEGSAAAPHGSLAAALLAAQAEMKSAVFNKTNPAFKGSKYADLGSVRDAAIPVLTAHGLAAVQFPGWDKEGRYCLTTRIQHVGTGEFIEGAIPIPDTGKLQEIGSALTYARRYGLVALAGLTSEEDDDANSAGTVTRAQAGVQAGKGTFSPTGEPGVAPLPAGPARATDMTVEKLREANKAALADVEAAEGMGNLASVQDQLRNHQAAIEQTIRRKPEWWLWRDDPSKGMKARIDAVIAHSYGPGEEAAAKKLRGWLGQLASEANPVLHQLEANNSEKEPA